MYGKKIKKTGLIVTLATMFLICAAASASATPTFTLTIQKGVLNNNTVFLPGETIVVNSSYSGITTLPYSIYLNVSNSTWNYKLNNVTLTTNTTGYAGNGTGWLNGTWNTAATGVKIGSVYSVYINGNGTPYNVTNVTFAGISVTPTGKIQASDSVTFYVNVTAWKPVNNPVIDLSKFGLGNVTTTYVTETTNSNGVPVYVYKATVDLSKATYSLENFSVRVNYTSSVNRTYTYSLNVTPNKPYEWIVLESTTNKPSGYPVSDDSAVPTTLGATTITAKEYIAVADKYGNVNDSFNGTYTATLAVLSGPGALNTTTITIGNGSYYKAVNVTVLTSDAPCAVTIQAFGSGLQAATKTIEFYPGIDHLSLTVSKSELYANNSDTAKLYVALKDSKGDTIPLKGVNINVSEVTTLGLNFTPAGNTTNSSGVAVFTVTADGTPGIATISAVVNNGAGYSWNGKYGRVNVTLLPAPNKTYTTVNWPSKIVAGVKVPITVTLKNYADQPIKNCDMYPITFNITSGDAKWLENNKSVITISKTDANGNATATLYTTNATSNKISINISIKTETGKYYWYNKSYVVTPNKVYTIAVYSGNNKVSSYAYPVGVTETVTFTIKYFDEFGNLNISSGTVKIVPQSSSVGTFSTATVNVVNGVGTVTFTTNASAPAGASKTFVFNDTTYKTGNVTLKIVASGVKGLEVCAPTYPKVNTTATVSAKLLGIDGIQLAKPNVTLTMSVLQPNGIYMVPVSAKTNTSGIATFTFKGVLPGKYVVKVYNTTYGIANTTTVVFVGNPVKLILSANKTTVSNGSTVQFKVETVDIYGMPSLPKNKYVNVLVNGILEKNVSLNDNAVATFNLTFNKTGTYDVYALSVANASLHDEIVITVTPPVAPANITITKLEVSPTSVTVGTPVTIKIYAANTGGVAGNITVPVCICNSTATVFEKNITIEVPAGKTTEYKFNYTPEAAGNYTVKVDGLEVTFTVTPPVAPANITITKLEVSPTSVTVGTPVTIKIYAANTGGVAGSKNVTIDIYNSAGEIVFETTKTITVPAGETTECKLNYTPETADNYTVVVDGLKVTFTVISIPPIDGHIPKPIDGVYKDVNGDGHFNFGDVVFFFQHLPEIMSNPVYAKYLDFNHDGKVNFGDVIALFKMLSMG